MSWDDAATYLLTEKKDLNDALTYSNNSIAIEDRFDNEMTKSKVLAALNRKDDAAVAQKKALELASPLQLHIYARQLQGEKRQEEAFVIFRENAKKHPDRLVRAFGTRARLLVRGQVRRCGKRDETG